MRIDQSSPVQPVSESRGGTLSLTEKEDGQTEILMSNRGYLLKRRDPGSLDHNFFNVSLNDRPLGGVFMIITEE